jgi:nitrate reductase / nitrite oxidoreductase, alpha subunit
MALLDAQVRKVGPDQALGAKGFDNYSWHTDLPPGHPMVTGQQTVEFDLNSVEHCEDGGRLGHELDHHEDARFPLAHRGAAQGNVKIVVIACEYSATASKGDDVIVVRPGTTPALALGLAHVILKEKLYDEAYVRQWTDLPVLVRTDTLEVPARAGRLRRRGCDAQPDAVLARGEAEPPPITHRPPLRPPRCARNGAITSGGTGARTRPGS